MSSTAAAIAISVSGTTADSGGANANTCPPKHGGYLELILGPMFSGKTSKLLEIYKQSRFCDMNVMVINYIADNRYSEESVLSTHDKQMIPCVKVARLADVDADELAAADTVLINEGQFFEDIELVRQWVEDGHKRVYICGLDGDFERKQIGGLLSLIPFCDEVYKLKSLCTTCKNGTPAVFSHRITCETSQVVIGSNNYVPLCRACYDQAKCLHAQAGKSIIKPT